MAAVIQTEWGDPYQEATWDQRSEWYVGVRALWNVGLLSAWAPEEP